MRKVIFHIDDREYFRRSLTGKYNITENQVDEILSGLNDFKAIYTLFGDGQQIDHYKLTDIDGNKMNINSLNNFQRGVILNDCKAYFEGRKYCFDGDVPTGVIKIEEEENMK